MVSITLPKDARVELITDRVHEIIVPGLRFVGITLYDLEWQPLAGLPCRLRIAGDDRLGTTDGDGKVVFEVTVGDEAIDAMLQTESETDGWILTASPRIDEMPGADTPVGQRWRLDNLGYVAVERLADDEVSRWSIEEFQCDQGLEVTGECDGATQAKLVEVHGH